MRKFGYILVSCLILLSLTACNHSSVDDSSVASTVNTSKPNNFESLIPSGWGVLHKEEPIIAKGDLNKDGIPDVAAVIEQVKSETDKAPQRALLIAFGTKDHSYTLSIISDKVILKADEGGIWGDPFESLSIDRGSVVISDYGGSNWRWYHKYRFRFQENDWYLIGATKGEYFTGSATEEQVSEQDYNLLTGDYIIKKTNEKGKIITTRGNKGKVELIKLRDFNMESINFQD